MTPRTSSRRRGIILAALIAIGGSIFAFSQGPRLWHELAIDLHHDLLSRDSGVFVIPGSTRDYRFQVAREGERWLSGAPVVVTFDEHDQRVDVIDGDEAILVLSHISHGRFTVDENETATEH